ncbi:MAG: nucleotidyltransferase family protein [Candidatus Latescibacterota bacterium]
MLAVEFIVQTLSHFVKADDGPPPGIPLHSGVNFEQELVRLCECQQLSPIIVRSLENLVLGPGMSRLSLERLKRDSWRIEQSNRRTEAKIQSLSLVFREKGIPFILFGGAAVARTAYLFSCLRAIDRIDILVKESNWSGTMECLQECGFEQMSGYPQGETPHEALQYHQLLVPCVFRDGEGDEVHISFRIFHLGFPEADEIAWVRSHGAESAEPFARGLSPEDQLIRHAIELTVGGFSDLRVTVDIAILLVQHRGKIEWEYIERRLSDRGHYPAFYFAIKHVGDLLQLPRACKDLRYPGIVRERFFGIVWNTHAPDFFNPGEKRQQNLKFGLLESRRVSAAALLRAILSPAPGWVAAFYGRPANSQLKLQLILRSLCGKWMKAERLQETSHMADTIKPGQRLLE